jgi:hypothetical protein
MAIETRPSTRSPTSLFTEAPARRSDHWGWRGAIAALAAFMALTAIQGAIFVVPTMPRSVLNNGVLALFRDYTIPALALGVFCGGVALVTLFTVFARTQLGALAAMVVGAFMITFELVEILVEILVVGFTPVQTPDQFPAWLQVMYLAVGSALIVLGAHLWKDETGSYEFKWPRM